MVNGVVSIPLPGYSPIGVSNLNSISGPEGYSCPFLVGPENRLVEVAVRAVLDSPGEGPATRYNPLLIHGASGTGKSHLAQGLAMAFASRYGQRVMLCVTATDFARELTDAIESQATEEFRRRYRQLRLLVIEDVTRLADKDAAQLELLHTLDALLTAGSRIIATASLGPGQWPRILPSLQSRLGSGLTVPLAPPGSETRLALVEQVARQRGIALSESVGRVLAEGLKGTAAELIGALAQLRMFAHLRGGAIDLDIARTFVAQCRDLRQVDMAAIASTTARVFSLKVSQLRSRSRRREVVTARGVAMYLARQLTNETLEEIGSFFGGRDHTTVLHGCRRTEVLMQTEPEIQEAVQRVHCGLQVA